MAAPKRSAPSTSVDGKYDGQLWDMDAKLDIFGAFDPESPRSDGPFEQNKDGNSCDASGYVSRVRASTRTRSART